MAGLATQLTVIVQDETAARVRVDTAVESRQEADTAATATAMAAKTNQNRANHDAAKLASLRQNETNQEVELAWAALNALLEARTAAAKEAAEARSIFEAAFDPMEQKELFAMLVVIRSKTGGAIPSCRFITHLSGNPFSVSDLPDALGGTYASSKSIRIWKYLTYSKRDAIKNAYLRCLVLLAQELEQ